MKRARYSTTGLLALEPKAFLELFDLLAPEEKQPFEEHGAVAVISVDGPLEQHPNWQWLDYETIEAWAIAAFTSSARAVAMRINSPGGAAAGCFELARKLREFSEETGKPFGVFIDGQATSAAFALASSATAGIWAPPTSRVASLAVYEVHVDETARDAAMGLGFTFIATTGADLKLTGNPHVRQSEEQVAHTQAQVDLLTEYFYELLADMRGLSRAEVQALRGACLLAQQGVDKRLVDSVGDWTAFLSHLNEASMSMQSRTTSGGAQAKASEEKPSEHKEMLAYLAERMSSDDEKVAAAAKKCMQALSADEEDGDGGEKKDEKPEGRKAEEPEKKEAKAEEKKDEPKATARASGSAGSNELDLAKRVQELEARDTERETEVARAALLSKRPDFSDTVRKTLASAPLEVVKQAVETWPRVGATSDPRAAAASAAVPQVTPGNADGVQSPLRPEENSLLARLDPQRGVAQAKVEGTSLVLEPMSPAAAAKRMEEMLSAGHVPHNAPSNAATKTLQITERK